jgi:hypothetical protein
MERLTEKWGDHFIARTERVNGKTVGNTMCLDKLGALEDLEEQGRLLVLPCKVGDTLYCVGTECLADIAPDEECDLIIDCDECVHNKKWVVFERTATKYLIGVLMGYGMLSNFEYKKNVFLTREEAEAKLEKLKGEEHE